MKKYFYACLILFYSTSIFGQRDLSVHVFIAEDCPISIYMVQPLKQALEVYGDKVTFYAVFPNLLSTTETAEEFLNTHDLSAFNIRIDTDQTLCRQLGAKVTPEAIISNEAGEILYRGRINDAFVRPGKMKHGPRINVLKESLAKALAAKPVPKPWVDAVGCFITIRKPSVND